MNIIFIFGWFRVLQKKHYGGLEGLQQIGYDEFHPIFIVTAGDEEVLVLTDLGNVE